MSDYVVKIDMNTEFQKAISGAKTAGDQRDFVYDFIMNNLRGKHIASDGRVVEICEATADKFIHRAPEIKLRVVAELQNMLKFCYLRNVVDVDHKIFNKFVYYDVVFQVDDKKYIGTLNVGVRKDGASVLYDMKPYNEI